MRLLLQWTVGRVVEGARLEREYRATYRGFESLIVHHIAIEVKNPQLFLHDQIQARFVLILIPLQGSP
jgi:hypothetical protein